MGIPEMLATSKDSGGMEGFFNSPIAMILMPRTAARFQEAKKDQMLLEQYNRKVQLAGQFADQIESKDPMAAAMIRADPSTMDNVFSAYYGAQKAQDLAKTNFGYDMQKEAEKARLARETELAKNNLPGGTGYHINMMGQFVKNSVADKTQGPNMPGMPTAGEVAAEDINAKEMTMALSKDYGLPDLTSGNALRIMTDPNAAKDLQANRISTLTGMRDTKEIVDPNDPSKKILISQDPTTGTLSVPVGQVPKSAEELKLGSQQITKMGPDGKAHIYSFVPGAGYTKDEGFAEVKSDPNLGDHVEVWDPVKKKTMIMGWNPANQAFTNVIGEAEPKVGTPMYAADGVTITGYVGGPGKKNDRTEAQAKGDSLYEGIRGLKTDTLDNFDELSKPQNTAGAANYERGGGFAMTGPAQVGMGSLKQVAQTYIYAQSGQQAPDSEVNRIMSMVMPALSDKPEMRAFKKKLLANMFRSIKAKTSGWTPEQQDMANAKEWDGTVSIPEPTGAAPALPEKAKAAGITKDFWEANPQYWPEFN